MAVLAVATAKVANSAKTTWSEYAVAISHHPSF